MLPWRLAPMYLSLSSRQVCRLEYKARSSPESSEWTATLEALKWVWSASFRAPTGA